MFGSLHKNVQYRFLSWKNQFGVNILHVRLKTIGLCDDSHLCNIRFQQL